jgi:hypothetical protein
MKPSPVPMTPAKLQQLAEETREVEWINQLPRAQRRVALRSCRSYRRHRQRTREQRRAFGGWAGAFRPGRGS